MWVKHLMWLIGGPSTNQHSQGVWFALKSRANHDYDNMPNKMMPGQSPVIQKWYWDQGVSIFFTTVKENNNNKCLTL